MTLLTICQDVANSIPIAAPASIIGNVASENAQILLAQANLAGQSLARKPQYGWISMISEQIITTEAILPQAGTIANSGPGGTAIITGLSGLGNLPTEFATYAWYCAGTGVTINAYATAATATSVTLNQAATQTGAGTFSFGRGEYALASDFERPIDGTLWDRSRFWSMRGPLSPQQWQLYKSSVIGRASIQRRYRIRKSLVSSAIVLAIDPTPFDSPAAVFVQEYVSNGWCQSAAGALQQRWVADTDTGVLDEYLLTLGTRWRTLRRLGLAYDAELDEYEREESKAIASDGGAAILDMTPPDRLTLIGPWNLPETNFGSVSGT